MAGRKPTPLQLINNKQKRDTKATLQAKEDAIPNHCPLPRYVPEYMSQEAKDIWHKMTAIYRKMEKDTPILGAIDAGSLEIYCNAKALYNYLTKELEDNKSKLSLIERDILLKQINIQVRIINSCREALLLDPVSRARINVIQAKQKDKDVTNDMDEMSKLLNGD